MKPISTLATALVLTATLSACGSTSIFGRDRPDEMAVQRQAPLVIPPDFALSPPAPGAPRPGTESTAEQTLRALFGGPAPRSASEAAVIGSAGGPRSDPGIRSTVGSPDTNVVDKGLVTRDIVAAPEGDGAEASAAIPG
ncbi:MAG: hypothetical protein RLZZ58_2080 [Pseudomonadota bacterium]